MVLAFKIQKMWHFNFFRLYWGIVYIQSFLSAIQILPFSKVNDNIYSKPHETSHVSFLNLNEVVYCCRSLLLLRTYLIQYTDLKKMFTDFVNCTLGSLWFSLVVNWLGFKNGSQWIVSLKRDGHRHVNGTWNRIRKKITRLVGQSLSLIQLWQWTK